MRTAFPFLLLLIPILLLSGCIDPPYEEPSEYSELPHTVPADWEYQRSLPGLPPSR